MKNEPVTVKPRSRKLAMEITCSDWRIDEPVEIDIRQENVTPVASVEDGDYQMVLPICDSRFAKDFISPFVSLYQPN
jgi:hypothetical protein